MSDKIKIEFTPQELALTLTSMLWIAQHSQDCAPDEWTADERAQCRQICESIRVQTPLQPLLDRLKILKQGDDQ